MEPLHRSGISETRGFLPAADPLSRLPGPYAAWEEVARDGSALILGGRLRDEVGRLPVLEADQLADGPVLERALLLLTVMANAHVRGAAPAADRLPPPLARPLQQVADRLGRPPIIAHASIVLSNWRRAAASVLVQRSLRSNPLIVPGAESAAAPVRARPAFRLVGRPSSAALS